MSQNKLRGGKESESSYSPHLCKDKEGKCTLAILFLFVSLPKIPEPK